MINKKRFFKLVLNLIGTGQCPSLVSAACVKELGVFYFPPPLDGMLVYHRVTSSIKIKFVGAHLYNLVGRGTLGVKCFAHTK